MLAIYISRFMAGFVNYLVYNPGLCSGSKKKGVARNQTYWKIFLQLEGTKPESHQIEKKIRCNTKTVPKDRDKERLELSLYRA